MSVKFRLGLLSLCWLVLGLVSAPAARAEVNGLNGDYADEGVLASGDAAQFAGGVSLHALLSLEFEPALVRKLHELAARVNVRQDDSMLAIKVYDRDGGVTKEGRWKKEAGPDSRVVLRFRSDDEMLVYTFEVTGEQRLLRLTVQRISPSVLGPVQRPVGTFLFPRTVEAKSERGPARASARDPSAPTPIHIPGLAAHWRADDRALRSSSAVVTPAAEAPTAGQGAPSVH